MGVDVEGDRGAARVAAVHAVRLGSRTGDVLDVGWVGVMVTDMSIADYSTSCRDPFEPWGVPALRTRLHDQGSGIMNIQRIRTPQCSTRQVRRGRRDRRPSCRRWVVRSSARRHPVSRKRRSTSTQPCVRPRRCRRRGSAVGLLTHVDTSQGVDLLVGDVTSRRWRPPRTRG